MDALSCPTELRTAVSTVASPVLTYLDMPRSSAFVFLVLLVSQEFSTLYQEYKRGGMDRNGVNRGVMDPGEMESVLWRLHGLYAGDFLEDSPYDEWISLLREQYKSIFVEASYALSLLLIQKESFQ